MRYRLSEAAGRDLEAIYDAGADLFGPQQAKRYLRDFDRLLERLAEYPDLAPRPWRSDLSVRAARFGAHLVFYRVDDDALLVIRVRHGREDWQSDENGMSGGD